MTGQPIEANVVLTADNSGYDQSMAQSSQATSTLIDSVDKLTAKVSKLTKTAGKSLIGIAAADVAVITGATAAWSSYEKQMERLKSQAAVLGRGTESQNKLMKDYTGTVKALRSEMGTTTTEAAKLTETLSKVTSTRQSRDLSELSKVFVQMGKATGESSTGLANSLTNLQKIMGTPVNSRESKRYADTFTYLAAQTNTSAQGLMDFTASLAPVAKSLGMNTQQVAGFATAFTQAGQDSGAAATAFTKISSDMLRSLQSGSPELATYANIVGTTSENFQKLADKRPAEAVIRVFEALSKNTKTASADLERLGLEGPRTIRSITALTNQPGGIRDAFGLADDKEARGASTRGYEATMKGLSDQFEALREDLKQTAEAFATTLAPAMEAFMTGLEKSASILQMITEGPVGQFLQVVLGLVAPLAGGAGALLLFAGALLKVAGAFMLLRNSATRGVIEGFQGKTGLTRLPDGTYAARGGGELGRTGANLLRGTDPNLPRREQSSWVQRGLYNVGQIGGAGLGSFRRGGAVPENFYAAREALSARMPWTEQYARPATPQSPLAMLSKGAGWTVSNLLTPQFDHMRHAGPSQRTTWAAQEAPWIRAGESMQRYGQRVPLIGGLSKAMGQVGLAQTQMEAQRKEYTKVQQDPLITDQARQARLAEIREIHRETAQKRNAALSQESAIRQEITQRGESAKATRAASQETKTFGQAMRGLARGVGGGIAGGIGAGLGASYRSGMMGQGLGMAGTVAGATMGNNALMMAGTGAMIGSMVGTPGVGTAVGAVAGGVAGLTMDMAKGNNAITESIKNLDATATQATKTGSGLDALHETTIQSKTGFDEYSTSMTNWQQEGLGPLESITTGASQIKNWAEGLVGKSDVEEAQGQLDKTTEKVKNTQDAFRELAEKGGVELTGSATQQRQQVEKFMEDRGRSALGQAGIEVEDFVKARGKPGSQYEMYLSQAISGSQGASAGYEERMRTSGQFGRIMMDDKTMKQSLLKQGDIALAYEATNTVFEKMRKQGMSYLEIVKQGEKAQAEAGDETLPAWMRAEAQIQKAQYALQMQAPGLGRVGAVNQQLQLTQAVLSTPPQTAADAAQREEQKQAAVQAMGEQDQYFRSMILAQRAYERSRVRAQEDFHLQRTYQEYDYNLSRQRAEESFNRQRARAVADYHRNVRRSWSDFHLQRRRQEEDYQHQIEVTAQQRAIGMNLYQRPATQRTSSATWLLSNTKKILSDLREQKRNLNRLRELGLSDAVIQQLQLTDPANAQELTRFVTELESDQAMVGRFNRTSSQLQKASKALVTDESSAEFKEMQRSFQQGRERGMDDMQRSMKRGRNDFRRGLGEQRDDFNIMMDEQAENYETQMNRQLKGYNRSMDRAAEDMAHMADEVLGSITDVLVTAQEELTGSAKKQATAALKSFKDLRSSTKPEAIALMRELSTVFGFEYTNPLKGGGGGGGGGGGASGRDANSGHPGAGMGPARQSAPNYNTFWAGGYGSITNSENYHEGGQVPGWSPGRDERMVPVSGGEAIMRPEWARAVGPRYIEAANHKARHGGFFLGGVMPLEGGALTNFHGTNYYGADWAGDLNGPYDLRNPPAKVSAFKAGTVADVKRLTGSYGQHVKVNHPDGQNSLYAHLSSIAVHIGDLLSAGQMLGRVGETGNAFGAHLHFELDGGQITMGDTGGGGGAGVGMSPVSGVRRRARRLLKDRYPVSERAAERMDGVHPLAAGAISTIINRMAARKIKSYSRMYRRMFPAAGNPTGYDTTSGLPAGADYGPNARGVWDALTGAGFSKVHAAGIMGNMQSESGFDPFIIQGGGHSMNPADAGGGGYGLVQWTPGAKLIPYLHGHRPSVATEVNAVREQLAGLGRSPEGAAGTALRNARSIRDATLAFETRYERHAGGPQPNRISQAQSIYDKYAANGAIVNGAQQLTVGEGGPEAVIPLNDRGADFMREVMGSAMGGRNVAPMGGGVSVHNYRIDKSTNFTGPITVQANDPNELLAKLQARQRVRALTRPAVSGSAA